MWIDFAFGVHSRCQQEITNCMLFVIVYWPVFYLCDKSLFHFPVKPFHSPSYLSIVHVLYDKMNGCCCCFFPFCSRFVKFVIPLLSWNWILWSWITTGLVCLCMNILSWIRRLMSLSSQLQFISRYLSWIHHLTQLQLIFSLEIAILCLFWINSNSSLVYVLLDWPSYHGKIFVHWQFSNFQIFRSICSMACIWSPTNQFCTSVPLRTLSLLTFQSLSIH